MARSAGLSETIGSFMFVLFYIISTDSKTRYSDDKAMNGFIIASSYIAARLISGGEQITGLDHTDYSSHNPIENFKRTGPLLNPAIAMGAIIASVKFDFCL